MQDTGKLNCKRCGYCCTLVARLSFFENVKIWMNGYRYFSEKDGSGKRCIRLVDGDCYFLVRGEERTFCKIYNIRPKVCRDFPYGEEKNVGECNVDKRSFKEKYLS